MDTNELKLVSMDEINTENLKTGEFIGSSSENLTCYLGYRPQPMKINLFCYSLCVGLRDGDDTSSYVKLENGALLWAYKPESTLRTYYHAPDFKLILPSGTQCTYSVISHCIEGDKKATEKAFGFIQEDLAELIRAYCIVAEIDGYKEGRIAFSKNRENNCDLTGAIIARNFPYITFAEANYIWSHVSLYGFYCHLAFLLHKGKRGKFYQLMVEAGAKEEWLARIKGIPEETNRNKVIT